MTTHRGHYLPVEARREVLRIYRSRRTQGVPFSGGPHCPYDAMRATVDYFSGWLAYAAAYGPARKSESVQNHVDQYRAAQFYLHRMYEKPDAFKVGTGRRA